MPRLCQSKNYNAKASKSRQYPRYTYSLWDLQVKLNIRCNHLYNAAVGLHVVLRLIFVWTNPRFTPWEFQAYSHRLKNLFYSQLFAWFLSMIYNALVLFCRVHVVICVRSQGRRPWGNSAEFFSLTINSVSFWIHCELYKYRKTRKLLLFCW
jgi:hypothetical protein